MSKGSLTRMISAGVILLSLVWIIANPGANCAPDFDARPHQAVGMVMARQALSLHKAGGKIIVIKRDTATFSSPAADAQFDAFSKALKSAKVAIDSVQLIQVGSLDPLAVPPGDFAEVIRRSGDNDVVVSFMGPPVMDATTRATLPEKGGAQIVAFCPGRLADRVDLPGLFRDGMLQAVVISKRAPSTSQNKPGSLQGWFDLQFQEVTAANIASVFPSAPAP